MLLPTLCCQSAPSPAHPPNPCPATSFPTPLPTPFNISRTLLPRTMLPVGSLPVEMPIRTLKPLNSPYLLFDALPNWDPARVGGTYGKHRRL